MGSINPQQTFNDLVAKNKNMSDAMGLVNQYGNGDPKTAFMNYAKQMGKEAIAQNILGQLGLK